MTRVAELARSIAPDSLEVYVMVKARLLAPTFAALGEMREQVNRQFLDVWFSEGSCRRRGEVRDRLLGRP